MKKFRDIIAIGNPLELANKTVLRPYQKRWANDPAQFALAVKSAQIGFSTATAARYVEKCLMHDKHLVILLSRGEKQSLELATKAKDWIDGYQGVISEFFPNQPFGETSILQHEIRFPNKSRIIALAANPDTARGYTGDIVLDEFGFHKDSDAIFKAAFRQTTLGFEMRVLSTPNGQQGKFFEMSKALGLELGIRPRRQPVKGKAWSGHWCDIYLAAEEGFPVDPEKVHLGCEGDEETWQQEYLCQFISQASQWFPPELYDRNTSVAAGPAFDNAASLVAHLRGTLPIGANLYLGWDIARKRDLSVIWLAELVGDVTVARAILEMRNRPTPDQVAEARTILPLVRRGNIDQSGMGLAIAEQLQREFPGRVEGVQFTAPIKESLAVLGKRRAEEGKVRLPDLQGVKASFTSMKKSTNAIGQARFDTEHDSKYGHGDHWWAYCLAEAAANQPTSHLSDCVLVGTPRPREMQPMPMAGMVF